MQEYQLRQKKSGAPGDHDEHWTLIVPDEGEPYVEYERSWGAPNDARVNRASSHHPLSEFLELGDPTAKARLKAVLREIDLQATI